MLHPESARAHAARLDIQRLAKLIAENSASLDAAADGKAAPGEDLTLIALRLMNAGAWLREQGQTLMDETTARIREDQQARFAAARAAFAPPAAA